LGKSIVNAGRYGLRGDAGTGTEAEAAAGALELPAPNSRRVGLRSRLFTARLISPTARVAIRPIANKGKRRQRRLRFCFWREHQPQLTPPREKYRSVQWNCDRPSIVDFDTLLLTAF
jgi:hypothetical protein